MATKVLLHVGTPKTGTSYVQDLLFGNRDTLQGLGILYPGDRFDAHFLAALDLMQLPWGGLEKEAVGAWERLAAQVREWPGTAVISHEIFGRASRQQVARALASLGDAEIHVLVSARDLVRQIPAEWQENLKHRRTVPYADFLDALRDPTRSLEVAQWFWGVQEVPDVLDRWGGSLPPEHVHVVTVPPPGAPKTLLWERFAHVIGVEPDALTPISTRANTSLGVAESAMIRRLNDELNLVLPNHHYRSFVRELLVHQGLSTQTSSGRLTVPPDTHEWATMLCQAWIDELQRKHYDIVGDLADLHPGPAKPFLDPDSPDESAVADAGVRALALAVGEAARLRDVEIELHGVIDDLMDQLDAAHSTPAYKAKEKLVAAADNSVAARAGLAAYRRLRGKSSRST